MSFQILCVDVIGWHPSEVYHNYHSKLNKNIFAISKMVRLNPLKLIGRHHTVLYIGEDNMTGCKYEEIHWFICGISATCNYAKHGCGLGTPIKNSFYLNCCICADSMVTSGPQQRLRLTNWQKPQTTMLITVIVTKYVREKDSMMKLQPWNLLVLGWTI